MKYEKSKQHMCYKLRYVNFIIKNYDDDDDDDRHIGHKKKSALVVLISTNE